MLKLTKLMLKAPYIGCFLKTFISLFIIHTYLIALCILFLYFFRILLHLLFYLASILQPTDCLYWRSYCIVLFCIVLNCQISYSYVSCILAYVTFVAAWLRSY